MAIMVDDHGQADIWKVFMEPWASALELALYSVTSSLFIMLETLENSSAL